MAGEKPIFLFCIPKQETYKKKSLDTIAAEYKMMAIAGFNNHVEFERDYEPGNSKPDAPPLYMLTKEEIKVYANLFLNERITRIGKIFGKFSVSSTLFNPDALNGEFLPDAEVIEVEQKGQIFSPEKILEEFQQFYDRYGWDIHLHKDPKKEETYEIPKPTTLLHRNRQKFPQAPQIIGTQTLVLLAELYGYNREKLCWT